MSWTAKPIIFGEKLLSDFLEASHFSVERLISENIGAIPELSNGFIKGHFCRQVLLEVADRAGLSLDSGWLPEGMPWKQASYILANFPEDMPHHPLWAYHSVKTFFSLCVTYKTKITFEDGNNL